MKQFIYIAALILVFCFVIFAQTVNENTCPKINLYGPKGISQLNEPVNFTVEIGKEAENYKIEYVWTVRGGKIIDGQGTQIIKVLINSDEVNVVTIKVRGLPVNCLNSFSESIAIDHPSPTNSRIIDRFGMAESGEKKARLDNFFVELQNNLYQEGIIKIQDSKNLKKDLTWILWYLTVRKFDKTRISIAVSDEIGTETEFSIVPPGVEIRECNNCLIIKAEDFDKLEKLFQPKPVTKKRKK